MRRRRSSLLLAVGLLALVMLRLSGTVGAQIPRRTFTATPTSVLPGQAIGVSAVDRCVPTGGRDPGVELTLSQVDGDPAGGEDFPVDAAGAWGGTFTVPEDVDPGPYDLEAACWLDEEADDLAFRYAPVRVIVGPAPIPCPADPPTIVGTSGPDKLVGTPGPDVIHGLEGADQITGLGGDDIICGGPGIDDLSGGDGDDRLYGDGDADRLAGGNDQDLLSGGTGDDRLAGGEGGDLSIDTSGLDQLAGDADDYLDTRDLTGGDVVSGGAVCRSDAGDQVMRCSG